MSKRIKIIHDTIKRNRQAKYDVMIRQNGEADMSSFRRKPYCVTEPRKVQHMRPSHYEYPFSVGDTIYEVYQRQVIPLVVSGFYIAAAGQYVIVEDDGAEKRIAYPNIYLSREQANRAIERYR